MSPRPLLRGALLLLTIRSATAAADDGIEHGAQWAQTSGERFIELIDLHDEDVRSGQMPSQKYVDRLLAAGLKSHAGSGHDHH